VDDLRKLQALYTSHRGALVKYAAGIVGDRNSAEDVVQEAYLRLDSISRGRSLDEPVGYLYRVVRNLAIDGRRRMRREAAVVVRGADAAAGLAADGTASPEDIAAARDELRLLAAAMAELPERTRIALEMRRFGGSKLREIAAHLGVSVTVAHELVAEGIAHCRRRVRPPR